MGDTTLAIVRLRDGTQASIGHVGVDDAAAMLEYVEIIASETDFITFGPGEFGMSLEEEIAFLRSLEDRSRGLMLKATVDGDIVANAVLSRSPRPRIRHVGELGLSVCRRFWGQGIARGLCRMLFTEATKVGISRVALRVRADNERAIRLYEQLGFTHEGRLAGAFLARGALYDEFVMGQRI